MTALEQLNAYLRRLELRLRLHAAAQGTAAVCGVALVLTVVLVWISNRYAFAQHVVFPLRLLLFFALAAAVSFLVVVPITRLTRRRVTCVAEQRIPGFEERLLTVVERADPANPFTELVAEDALGVASDYQPARLASTQSLVTFFASGAVLAAVLLWLIAAAPGYWGYGASLLWTGGAKAGQQPIYDIAVAPGNKTVRRKADQLVTARLLGLSAHDVVLHAKYATAMKWDAVAMHPKADANGYEFVLAGLSEKMEYYVSAGAIQSKHFTINVKDLPSVRRVRVALHYPSGLGLPDAVQDPGGDVRAVVGSTADISVLTDRPLDRGVLVLENGAHIALSRAEGNWATARVPIRKDGSYHIAAADSSEFVRISDDYFIEAKKDEPASVQIVRPGHDPRVSPIEEVPVTVTASDDFGVQSLELHYSVNGGPEQVTPLLKSKGVKETQATTTLYLENFKVVPGDLISFYATARDANTTSRTEISFAQAEPFDFKFTQSQQMGGGGMGGAGNQDNNISERQKQIIAATFNEVRNGGEKARSALEQDARFLSELEGKLGEQAKTLADRMGNRELSQANSEFQEFSKFMTQASSQMDDAVTELKPGKWSNALMPEEKALQSLLRAEAMFRDIQVAFGQQGGGGGMGGGSAQRDLARMFDLELDTSKNQYETGQNGDGSSSEQQKAVDDAFERLKMLAQRQQELAAQNNQQKPFEQRWDEEQLRREAEALRQQMQQLSQNSSGQNSSSSSQSSSAQSSGSQSQSGRQSAGQSSAQQNRQSAEALRQSTDALRRAEDEMRKAVSQGDATAQQRAASELRQAQEMLEKLLHQQAGSSVSDLAERAQSMANTQKELAERMKRMYGERTSESGTGNRAGRGDEGAESMPEMNDPNSFGYGYGFRRRNWEQLQSGRAPTEEEKSIAGEKERLANGLDQLQRQMQQEAQGMAGSQPDASSKMRHALSEAEQKELALRLQKDAEWMRQGYGDRNLGMEDSVTAGLEQLSKELRGVEESMGSAKQPGTNGQNDQAAEALSQLQALREQLQRGGDPNQSGGDPSQGGGGRLDRGDVGSTMAQLNGLRAQLEPGDRALGGYIDNALWNLRHLTGAQAGLLDSRISRDAAISLERLEVELNKRLAHQQAAGARTSGPEAAPGKYRDAVAEYFKKLSQ